jgi:hypothetical protein
MRLFPLSSLAVAVLASAAPASAGDVTMAVRDGRVTLTAHEAPIRQVLAEWAKQGRTRIVNLERVVGAPLTIELKDVPEQKALAIVLRSVAGYIAAPRATYDASASLYDRILILPTSSAAPAPAAPLRTAAPPPMMQMPSDVPDPSEIANEEPTPGGPPVFNPNGPEVPPPAPGQFGPQPANETAQPQTTEPPPLLSAPGVSPAPAAAPAQTTSPMPGVLPPPPNQPKQ